MNGRGENTLAGNAVAGEPVLENRSLKLEVPPAFEVSALETAVPEDSDDLIGAAGLKPTVQAAAPKATATTATTDAILPATNTLEPDRNSPAVVATLAIRPPVRRLAARIPQNPSIMETELRHIWDENGSPEVSARKRLPSISRGQDLAEALPK